MGTVITLILGQIFVATRGKTFLGMFLGILLYITATIFVVALVRLILSVGLWIFHKLPKSGLLCVVAVFIAVILIPYAIWYWIIGIGGIAGGLVSLSFSRGWRRPSSLALFATAILVVGMTVWWLLSPGDDSYLARPSADGAPVEPLSLPSPAERGPLPFEYLTYGSGNDLRRPEFGPTVAIRTSTVDVSCFLPELGKWRHRERWSYWGFDPTKLPLNGRVWYPMGSGPYPLVMIVHGNHPMWENSDSGYTWLAEHLASHGFVVVSIDANFLNSSVASDYDQGENFARTLLLYQHLALWKQFSSAPSSRFAGKVDFSKIALVGHSRGGQAVTTAAGFNRLSSHPENGNFPFHFQYDIQSVVLIAPMDPYLPSGSPVPLSNVNILALGGGHDADTLGFWGLRPYYRTTFSGDQYYCKASAYLYRANHSAFNTIWGDRDYQPPLGWLLNHKPVMAPQDQRKTARVLITAFLKGTVKGETAYLDLLRDTRRGRHWLPDEILVTQFEDSRFRLIADFSEDLDPITATVPGGAIVHENFSRVMETVLNLRNEASTEQKVVFLGWKRSDWKDHTPALLPQYSIFVPESLLQEMKFGPGHRLSFILCDTQREPEVVDLSVEVEDESGHRVRLPLRHFAPIHPPLISKFSKGFYDFGSASDFELIPQTFELPMKDFLSVDPQFDPSRLRVIRFVFDQSESGEILLGRIGIAASEESN
ncbi:MAG: hypothetical protein GX455_16955 [Phycisphaerae bacterium]|nr:hypothetical protein [Phycisphaerae bacterium]